MGESDVRRPPSPALPHKGEGRGGIASSLHHLRHDEEMILPRGRVGDDVVGDARRRVTLSSRIFRRIGVTRVIGSTLATSTSSSCLTQSRMPESSFSSALASASVILMRASRAMRCTVFSSTSIARPFHLHASILRCTHSRRRGRVQCRGGCRRSHERAETGGTARAERVAGKGPHLRRPAHGPNHADGRGGGGRLRVRSRPDRQVAGVPRRASPATPTCCWSRAPIG